MELKRTKIKLITIKVKSLVTSQATNGRTSPELNTDYTWVGR